MKYGFELEAFVRDKDGKIALVPDGLPFDECGWLVEIRSEPHTVPIKALGLLLAEKNIVERMAKAKGVDLDFSSLNEVPRDLKVEARRKHQKSFIKYRNIYGHQTHKNSTKLQTASLHISVTNERKVEWNSESVKVEGNYLKPTQNHFEKTYQGFIDHAALIVGMDKAFEKEINASKRNPGFYEVKDDGRIEYRSLPNNVDLNKVVELLEKMKLG